MFEFERKIYDTFRNKQIYDACCGEGVCREYVITASPIMFIHMKGCGRAILKTLLKGSGWGLAFAEQPQSTHIVLMWVGARDEQTVLGAISG